MATIAHLHQNGSDVMVEVLSQYEYAGRPMASVRALKGTPFTDYSCMGGPSNTATTQVPAGLLHDVTDNKPTQPNLMQLALSKAKTHWQETEKIYLITGKVYLSCESGEVNLHMIGQRPYVNIFWFDLVSWSWRVNLSLETKYPEWVAKVQPQRAPIPQPVEA